LALKAVIMQISITEVRKKMLRTKAGDSYYLKGLAKFPHLEHTLAAHVDCKLAPS
jgi:hypothetical protein